MPNLDATIELRFPHRIRFTHDVLAPSNPALLDAIAASDHPSDRVPARLLCFLDTGVARAWPNLPDRLRAYAAAHADQIQLAATVQPVIGGEACKNDRDAMYRVLNAIEAAGMDRHGFIVAIGGGAVLDCVGFAAAIAHRGMRLIRLPTTTLAQADSGVGVKNGINGFGQKNFLGTFAPPWGVLNDSRFLETLDDRHWRSGFAETVKVALVKDATLFEQIAAATARLRLRDMVLAGPVIEQSAHLHFDHIALGGDPFELTDARPLDFGHWAAHRLETMTDYQLSHGDAVAIGMTLDAMYSHQIGLLATDDLQRLIACLRSLGLPTHHPALSRADELMKGIEQFRRHLGGRLTITLLRGIGQGIEVHQMDAAQMQAAARELSKLALAHATR